MVRKSYNVEQKRNQSALCDRAGLVPYNSIFWQINLVLSLVRKCAVRPCMAYYKTTAMHGCGPKDNPSGAVRIFRSRCARCGKLTPPLG